MQMLLSAKTRIILLNNEVEKQQWKNPASGREEEPQITDIFQINFNHTEKLLKQKMKGQ